MDFKDIREGLEQLGKFESRLRTKYEKLGESAICLLITVRGGHVFNDTFRQEGRKLVAKSKYYPITFPVVCKNTHVAIREEIDKTLQEGRVKTHSYEDIVSIIKCTIEEAEDALVRNIQNDYFTLRDKTSPEEKQKFLEENDSLFVEFGYKKKIRKSTESKSEQAKGPDKKLKKVRSFKRNLLRDWDKEKSLWDDGSDSPTPN